MLRRKYLSLRIRRNSKAHDGRYDRAANSDSDPPLTDTLTTALQEFEDRFAEETYTQAARGTARAEVFKQTLVELGREFQAGQQRRDALFLEEMARQQDVYRRNYAVHEAVFRQGQDRRAAAFQRGEDARGECVEWHAAARAALLLEGRQARKDVCAAIDEGLVAQVEKFLKRLDEGFVRAEQERDNAVLTLLDDGIGSTANNAVSPRAPGRQIIGPVLVNSPEHGLPKAPSSACYNRDSFSPTLNGERAGVVESSGGVEFDAIQPISRINGQPSITLVSDWAPNDTPEAEQQDPQLAEAPGLVDTHPNPQPVGDTNTPAPGEVTNGIEEPSTSVQQQRILAFLTSAKEREAGFQLMQAALDAAEADRTQVFEAWRQRCEGAMQQMMDAHTKYFDGQEASRGAAGDIWQEVARLEEDHRARVFEQSLAQLERRVEVENALEDELLRQMKAMRTAIARRQMARVDLVRKSQYESFEEAQQRRGRDVDVGGSLPTLNLPGIRWPGPWPGLVVRYGDSGDKKAKSEEEESLTESERPPRQRYSFRVRNPRRASPPAGFGPTALTRGANLQDPLPVPGVAASVPNGTEEAIQGTPQDLPYSSRGAGSKAWMEDEYEKEMLRRADRFALREKARQYNFERNQCECTIGFVAWEQGQEEVFQTALSRWAGAFQQAEDSRQRGFCEDERARDWAFAEEQRLRHEKFDVEQRKVQERWCMAERQRLLDLEAWGAEFLQFVGSEYEKIVKVDEGARDEYFKQWLRLVLVREGALGSGVST